jgi:MFS family permease
MPMIRNNFALSYTQSGLLMSAFSITNGISQLLIGWLANRLGTRLIILMSVTGVAIVGIIIGLTHSYVALIIFLVLAALIGGGYHPASGAVIASSVPAKYRGRAFGVHFMGGSSAFWVLPLIAAPIAVALGWRSSFLILSIPTVLIGILLYILIGSRIKSQVIEHQEIGKQSATGTARIPWRKLLPVILISVTVGTMVMSVTSYLSLYAVDNFGFSEAAAAMLVAITPAIGFIAAPLGGYLSDRFGSITVLLVISFLTIPLIYLLGIASNTTALIIIMVAIGTVSTMRMPTSESYITGTTPEHRRAAVLGLYFFASTEVSGIWTPVVGILIDNIGFRSTFTITSVVTGIVVVFCSLFLWKNKSHKKFNL